MQIRMRNAELLTGEQIIEFLKGGEGIEFEGQKRAEVYGWVERVLVAQEYAGKTRNSGERSDPTGAKSPD